MNIHRNFLLLSVSMNTIGEFYLWLYQYLCWKRRSCFIGYHFIGTCSWKSY